jgi:hypothetical protein
MTPHYRAPVARATILSRRHAACRASAWPVWHRWEVCATRRWTRREMVREWEVGVLPSVPHEEGEIKDQDPACVHNAGAVVIVFSLPQLRSRTCLPWGRIRRSVQRAFGRSHHARTDGWMGCGRDGTERDECRSRWGLLTRAMP